MQSWGPAAASYQNTLVHGATRTRQEQVLSSIVGQYKPLDSIDFHETGITVIAAGANGILFHARLVNRTGPSAFQSRSSRSRGVAVRLAQLKCGSVRLSEQMALRPVRLTNRAWNGKGS